MEDKLQTTLIMEQFENGFQCVKISTSMLPAVMGHMLQELLSVSPTKFSSLSQEKEN